MQKSILEFLDAWNDNPKPFGLDLYGGIDHGKALSRCRQMLERFNPVHSAATEQKEEQ